MANRAQAYPVRVLCPLVDREINDVECLEVQDAAEKVLKADMLPVDFTRRDNWREVCKACKYHEND